VIARAVLCPYPPLLARELTGRDAVVPELHAACAEAVAWLVRDAPGRVIVVGPAPSTADWDPGARLDLSAFAPALKDGGKPDLPLSVGLGALLLDQAGYVGPRIVQAVGEREPAARCMRLGVSLAAAAGNGAVMLVLGDGSARRSVSAPGHLDERAVPFDDAVQRAVRDGDLAALAGLDPGLAHDLMVTGRPAWQVLAGAWGPGRPAAEVLYADAPFGVAYLVARFEAAGRERGGDQRGAVSVSGGWSGAAGVQRWSRRASFQ
jgi:hypothetical protein